MKEFKYYYPVRGNNSIQCPYKESYSIGSIACLWCDHCLVDRIDEFKIDYKNSFKSTLVCDADETYEKNKLYKTLLLERGKLFFGNK